MCRADHNQWDFEEDIVKPTSLFLATYMPDEPFAEDLILDTDPTHLALEDKCIPHYVCMCV